MRRFSDLAADIESHEDEGRAIREGIANLGPLFEQASTPKRFDVPLMREAMGRPDPKGQHATHRLHANSRAAWRTLDLPGRAREVLAALEAGGKPMTDRALCLALGSADMNYARPTVTRLVDEGVLVEVDTVECPVTGRQVRRVWFAAGVG